MAGCVYSNVQSLTQTVVHFSWNLGENAYEHNISAKSDNQPICFSHFKVMALYLIPKAQLQWFWNAILL